MYMQSLMRHQTENEMDFGILGRACEIEGHHINMTGCKMGFKPVQVLSVPDTGTSIWYLLCKNLCVPAWEIWLHSHNMCMRSSKADFRCAYCGRALCA